VNLSIRAHSRRRQDTFSDRRADRKMEDRKSELYKSLKNWNVVSIEQAERGGDDPMLQWRVVRFAERTAHRERDE